MLIMVQTYKRVNRDKVFHNIRATTSSKTPVKRLSSLSSNIGKRGDIVFDTITNSFYGSTGTLNTPLGQSYPVTDSHLFVFGASLEDTGNRYELGLDVGALAQTLCDEVGPKNRSSNGYVYTDFVASALNKRVQNSATFTAEDTLQKDQVLNFAISGAFVNGNVNNNPPDPQLTAGPNGYNAQITSFITLKNAGSFSIKDEDVFIYGSVGGNDLFADSVNVVPNFIPVHLDNIQRLYDEGCRNLILVVLDPDVLSDTPPYTDLKTSLLPGIIRQDIANSAGGAVLQGARGLSQVLINGGVIPFPLPGLLPILIESITNSAGVTLGPTTYQMPLLNLSVVKISTILKELTTYPEVNGVRIPNVGIASSDYDPRNAGNCNFPYPTMCSAREVYIPGVAPNPNPKDILLPNTLFYDDLHPTEQSHTKFAEIVLRQFKSWMDVGKHMIN